MLEWVVYLVLKWVVPEWVEHGVLGFLVDEAKRQESYLVPKVYLMNLNNKVKDSQHVDRKQFQSQCLHSKREVQSSW